MIAHGCLQLDSSAEGEPESAPEGANGGGEELPKMKTGAAQLADEVGAPPPRRRGAARRSIPSPRSVRPVSAAAKRDASPGGEGDPAGLTGDQRARLTGWGGRRMNDESAEGRGESDQ